MRTRLLRGGAWLRIPVLCLVGAMTLAACGGSDGGSKAGGDKLQTIKIGFQPNVNAATFMASATKAFEKNGLKPEFIKFVSGPSETAALQGGEIDVAYGGATAFSNAMAAGGKFEWIITMMDYNRNEALVIPAGSDIKSVADLRGKKIGFPFGSDVEQPLYKQLAAAGIPLSSVKLLNLAPPAGVAAVLAKDVDAMYEFSPYIEQITDAGGSKLFTSADTPGGGDSYLGFAVNANWAAEHEDAVVSFVKALGEGHDAVAGNEDKMLAETVRIAGISLEVAKRQFAGEKMASLNSNLEKGAFSMCPGGFGSYGMTELVRRSLDFFSKKGAIPKLDEAAVKEAALKFVNPKYVEKATGTTCQ